MLNTSGQVVLSDDCENDRVFWRIKAESGSRYSFINKSGEAANAYTMTNNNSGSPGSSVVGESYNVDLKARWNITKTSPTSITLSPNRISLQEGTSYDISISVIPSMLAGQDISWTSTNKVSIQKINNARWRITALQTGWVDMRAVIGGVISNTIKILVTNTTFNNMRKTTLVNDFENLLGPNLKSLIHHYTPAECINIILGHDEQITTLCCTPNFEVPKAYIQALLMRELWCVNTGDDAADILVEATYKYYEKLEAWEKLTPLEQLFVPVPIAPIPIREDSSTGIGQMFGKTGIGANNHAILLGIISGETKNSGIVYPDICGVWRELRDNESFAVKMVYLELFHCALKNAMAEYGDESRANYNFFSNSSENIKKVLARYNGSGDGAIQYATEVYEYYLLFNKHN